MKKFMDEEFLLSTPTAQKLYHEYAENMPIIDYHCHLRPKEIAENKPFRNITELFLGGDHYKWRFMASMGIDDELIRGNGDDYEKFLSYAKCISMAIGNPLYHWTHLELKRVFGISEPLNENSAREIWNKCNEMLSTEEFLPRRLIERFNVKVVCTTDDPADNLEYHEMLSRQKDFSVRVLPTFRPEWAMKIDLPAFPEYIERLSKAAGICIESAEDVVKALSIRAEFFAEHGCRISDMGMDTVPAADYRIDEVNSTFCCAMKGEKISPDQCDRYRGFITVKMGEICTRHNWAQQYHMNAQRNNNGPIFRKYGNDVGFDSISDELISRRLNALLNAQEESGNLPKTILYTLNPAANYILGTTIGNFQTVGGIPGKMQFGAAWWFCDQQEGMREHLQTLGALGALSTFVGMLTDSRSFVSYPRHEYFRRILCDVIGKWVENGEFAEDWTILERIVKGICYENAERYFGF